MVMRLAALAACAVLALTGCSKSVPPTSGTAAFKLKESVWVSYGWSRNRMAYIIYFVPSTSPAFNEDGLAATLNFAKEGDTFEGGLDGYADKSKVPFKCDAKTGAVTIEGKPYRSSNGAVFLVNVGPPTKVQQVIVTFPGGPKDTEQTFGFMEAEVKRIAAENPKIKEFPKELAPDKTKKK
jgi:hypothetical protein